MSDWALIVTVFWLWYFADCVKIGRRQRFVLGGVRGGGKGRVKFGPVTLAPVWPVSWKAEAEDPTVAFSPEGLSNVAVGSAGRPSPMPERAVAWRWEEIRGLAEKRGEIHINGAYFCRATPLVSGKVLRALIDGAKARSGLERERWLERRVADWFRVERLKRERRLLAGRTAWLAEGGTVGAVLAAGASLYLFFGDRLGLGAEAAEQVGRMAPGLGWGLAALHLWLVVEGWRVHRRLMPTAGEGRLNLMMSVAFLPPQAYRLRNRIGAEYLSRQVHPLAWIAAVAPKEEFEVYARQALADLEWPLQPVRDGGAEQLEQAISSWMRRRVRAEIGRLLAARGVDAVKLMEPPVRDSAQSCAYCPRCGSQFSGEAARCPHGVALKRFE